MEKSKFISSIQKFIKFRNFDEEYLLSLNLPCGTKFSRVLMFTIFSAIRKNSSRKEKLPQTFSLKHFLQSKYSLTLIRYTKKTVLRDRVCSITTCLFHSETKRYRMKYWFICLKISISVARSH